MALSPLTDFFISETERLAVQAGVSANLINDKNAVTETLDFADFKVIIKFGSQLQTEFSFLEGSNVSDCMLVKFKFPFSEINYSIYDIHNTVDDRIFTTYDFHCLYNDGNIKAALGTVFDFIERNREKISVIQENADMQRRLNDSFCRALAAADKKLTYEKYVSDADAYETSVDTSLYILSNQDNGLEEFALHSSTNRLQKFYAKRSSKGKLLPFEERYLEYLFQNDFDAQRCGITDEIKSGYKNSNLISICSAVTVAVSAIIGFVLDIIAFYCTKNQIYDAYTEFSDSSRVFSIIFIILCLGVYLLIFEPVQRLMLKKKNIYRKRSRTGRAVYASVGIILIIAGCVASHTDAQRCVAVNENEIYYNADGRQAYYSYNDVKLYLIEGEYYGDEYYETDDDKSFVMVVGDDYGNYCRSLSYTDVKNVITKSTTVEGSFKTLDEFEKTFDIK